MNVKVLKIAGGSPGCLATASVECDFGRGADGVPWVVPVDDIRICSDQNGAQRIELPVDEFGGKYPLADAFDSEMLRTIEQAVLKQYHGGGPL
jgi:hypothetical protein